MDSLKVQTDTVASAVRLLLGGEAEELSPAEARGLASTLEEKADDLEGEPLRDNSFREAPDDDQGTLDEVTEEDLEAMYDRVQSDDRDPPSFGDVVNPNDPMKW